MRLLLLFKSDLSPEEVKRKLRQSSIDVIDVRRGRYMEVDVRGEDIDLKPIFMLLGEPLEVVNTEHISGTFWSKFNQERFWECHELLEDKWRISEGEERDYLQALILICTSLLKYKKNQLEVSDKLMEKALSLIAKLSEDRLPLLYRRLILDT